MKLCFFLVVVSTAAALKFDLPPAKVKCFSDDIPDNTLVLGRYDIEPAAEQTVQASVNVQVNLVYNPSYHQAYVANSFNFNANNWQCL
jgi:hypothetical protein